jgi:hypothetical protein
LPDRDAPIASEITSNPKFSSFFDNAIGAIDGTQVNCVPSSTEQQNACNRKGGITHNVLACCSFDLRFQYFLSGSDGTAADSGMFNRVRCNVTHKPDLRTANYAPEFPLICHLLSPLSSVTTTATVYAVVITAAAIYVASAISAILDVAAAFTITTAVVVVTDHLDQQDKLVEKAFHSL